MELKHITKLEKASQQRSPDLLALGLGVLFLVGVLVYALYRHGGGGSLYIVAAAVVGAYMALNIGANDVANNVGPAVGARALTMVGALALAAVFDAAGALIAGGGVVETISSGIIDPALLPKGPTFVWVMLSALMGSALALNAANALGAPVSTTHSIVGAVVGSGLAASGPGIVAWGPLGVIAASWVVSPLMGGVIAAGLLYLVKRSITYQADKVAAARRVVPWLMAAMCWSFVTYLLLKGVNLVLTVSFAKAAWIGLAAGAVVWAMARRALARRATTMANNKEAVNSLFTLPLVFAAALLSFAHGSNDVANAVGPLAAIVNATTAQAAELPAHAPVPSWVMWVGALGISVGLALFGPRVIRTVGSGITELDQIRAFCIAMSTTLTVIVASELGLPISSTHIAVGAVIGVGFLREFLKNRYERLVDLIKAGHPESDQAALDAFLCAFRDAGVKAKGTLLADLKARAKRLDDPANFSKTERKQLKKVYRRELVKRSQLLRIAAAWVFTVPASAALAALCFFILRNGLGGTAG